ncbi:MAG: hypothetical protein R2939_05625 [Kofleriaceae bacterium]
MTTHLSSLLVLLALAPGAGCTLYFDGAPGADDVPADDVPADDRPAGDTPDDDDDDGEPPVQPGDGPTEATLAIGSGPQISATYEGWSTVWINYPAFDCTSVDRYGAWLPVLEDDALAALRQQVVGPSGEPIFVDAWLTLVRDEPSQLWRVSEIAPGDEPAPACYQW